MIFIWVVLPILAVFLMGAYIVRNIFKGIIFFCKNMKRKTQIILTAVISVVLIAPAINIYEIWFIALIHFVVLFLVCNLIYAVAGKIASKPLPRVVEGIYRSGVVALLIAIVILTYGYYNMNHVIRTEYQITTDKELQAEGYRLAVLSDLHYGISLDNDGLREAAQMISSEEPDIVILDGDIVDESTTYQQMKDAFAILGTISSKYGIYYVYGNHDMNNYTRDPEYSVEELNAEIEEAGITILNDSSVEINNEIILIGRADAGNRDSDRKSINELVASLDSSKEWVVLDHQPTEYSEVEEAGGDLIISGHTHAGQIWPAGVFLRLVKFDDLNYGYDRFGDMDAIVTSGIAGWGFPIRTEKHSEYIIVDIQSANK